MDPLVLSTGLAAALAAMALGGGLYETRVLDAAWPAQPALIQPARGGADRKRFWMPMHGALEAALLASLALGWAGPARWPMLVAVLAQGGLRLWSFADHIPAALRFERADPWQVAVPEAEAWVRRSRRRLPLMGLTAGAALLAFVRAL
jgi:hypothetical protein